MAKTIDDIRLDALESEFECDENNDAAAEITAAARALAKAVIENVPWSQDRDRIVEVVRQAAKCAIEEEQRVRRLLNPVLQPFHGPQS